MDDTSFKRTFSEPYFYMGLHEEELKNPLKEPLVLLESMAEQVENKMEQMAEDFKTISILYTNSFGPR